MVLAAPPPPVVILSWDTLEPTILAPLPACPRPCILT